jgi:hypothetical protein
MSDDEKTEKKYVCPYCGEDKNSRQALAYHKKVCEKRPKDDEKEEETDDKGAIVPGIEKNEVRIDINLDEKPDETPATPPIVEKNIEANRKEYEAEHGVTIPDPVLESSPTATATEEDDDIPGWAIALLVFGILMIAGLVVFREKISEYLSKMMPVNNAAQ